MLGPTTFTKDYKLNPDGSLSLTLRYDTVRRRFTPAEADAIRDAVVKLRDGEALKVTFEQVGETFLSSGNVGQAIKEFRALAKLHPTEALHRIQICRALLAAGLGEEARKEADVATKLEPKNVDAWQNLGWTYQHDLLGRRFRKGFEYDLSVSAYKTAQGIEPDNLVATADLAILLEHDHLGLRYSPASQLGEAIVEYQKIKDKVKDTGLANNLPVALLYAHKYQEARDLVSTLNPSLALHGVRLACVAATEGSGNAIELAQKLIADEGDRRQALLRAGNWLEALRLYPQSADLITAGAQGRENAATLLARAEKNRKAVRLEEVPSAPADPIDVIRRNFISWEGGGSLEDFISEYSSSGQTAAKDPETVDDFNRARFGYLKSALDGGTLPEIFRDVSFASEKFVSEGTASTGYRIKMINTAQDRNPYTYYIVSEGDQCKILGPEGVDSVGKWVITLADKGDLEGARRWLDWARDAIKMRGGEDPLADSPFTHLWTKGDQGTVEDIRLAAASIAVLGVDRTVAEPILLSALTGTLTPEKRLLGVQALGMASWDMKKWDQALKCFQELLNRYPRSWVAFRGTAVAMSNLHRWDDLQRLGEERLKVVPDDDDARRLLANLAMKKGDAAAVRACLQQLIDAGKGESSDYNNLAWVLMFDDGIATSPACVEYARQSVAMSDGNDAGSLHTLAAVYAGAGKTAEALEVLLKSMDKARNEEPTFNDWYVIGCIAEQYGEADAALLAYDRVNPKEQPERENPFGTYLLAKRRADALRAKAQASGTPKRTN
jgi:tetratricopeptide (TPR) repeat protein